MRKDVRYMLNKDWEPKVPSVDIIRKQSSGFAGRLSGSVRLAEGRVSNLESGELNKKRNRICKND